MIEPTRQVLENALGLLSSRTVPGLTQHRLDPGVQRRKVKRWRDARMALRWTATAMLEGKKGFRRLKAYKQLPILRAALLRHQQALLGDKLIASKNLAA